MAQIPKFNPETSRDVDVPELQYETGNARTLQELNDGYLMGKIDELKVPLPDPYAVNRAAGEHKYRLPDQKETIEGTPILDIWAGKLGPGGNAARFRVVDASDPGHKARFLPAIGHENSSSIEMFAVKGYYLVLDATDKAQSLPQWEATSSTSVT